MSARESPPRPILIVDDEPDVVAGLSGRLKANGFSNVAGCQDGRELLERVRREEPEVILLDLRMPHVSGQQLLDELHEGFPYIPVIVVTGSNDVETAVRCMSRGAFDYVVKVGEDSRLIAGLRRALERRRMEESYLQLKEKMLSATLADPSAFAEIVAVDRASRAVLLLAESVARSREPILITGESGVGKTLLARAVHAASGRKGKYVEVNVAGVDDDMFGSTLFGHRKGSFTTAIEDRGGLIQQAAGGTLLLDEIGDLSPASQAKLLQLFDSYEYYRVGEDVARRAEVRFVVATNHDLQALMAGGRFRKDLYYRLLTHAVRVAPLRERREDLPALLRRFIEAQAAELGRKPPRAPAELLQLLQAYDFPGNVRELERMVRHAMVGRPSATLPLAPFREWVRRAVPADGTAVPAISAAPTVGPASAEQVAGELPAELLGFGPRLPTLRQTRRLLFAEALRRAGGNQSVAAGLLGITHQAFSKAWRSLQGQGEA